MFIASVDPQSAAAKNATARDVLFPKGWAVPSQLVHFVNAVDGDMKTALKIAKSAFVRPKVTSADPLASATGGQTSGKQESLSLQRLMLGEGEKSAKQSAPWIGIRRSGAGIVLGAVLVAAKEKGMQHLKNGYLQVSADGGVFETIESTVSSDCVASPQSGPDVDRVCAEFVNDATSQGLSAAVFRPKVQINHAIMAARVVMNPSSSSQHPPVDLLVHEVALAPAVRWAQPSRALVVSTTPARTFGELLDCPMAELALSLSANATVDFLYAGSTRMDGVGHMQAKHYLARHGITMYVLPFKEPLPRRSQQDAFGAQLPTVVVPQAGIMQASLRFAQWLQGQGDSYSSVHFSTLGAPVAVAELQRRSGVAHLHTSFVGHVVTTTASTSEAGARFLDSVAELS